MEINEKQIAHIKENDIKNIGFYSYDEQGLHIIYSSVNMPAYASMNKQEYEQLTKEDPLGAVVESDKEKIIPQIKRIISTKEPNVFTFRIYNKTKLMTWIHVEAQYIGEMEGMPIVMAFFSGTSSSEETSFEAMMANLTTSIYVIDKMTYELLYVNAHALKASHYRNYIGTKCHQYFNGLYEPCPWCSMPQMKDGKVHIAENYVPPLKRWFEHDAFDIDWYGRKAAAFYLTDITEKKKQEEVKVKGLYHRILKANPDALAMFQLNLTKNTCSEGQSQYVRALEEEKEGTASYYFHALCSDIIDEKIKDELEKMLTCENLIKEFQQGTTEKSMEFPIEDSTGNKMWIKGNISMVQNPVNNDIEAVTYAVNITDKKKLEKVMNRITMEDYDFVAIISVKKKTIDYINIANEDDKRFISSSPDFDETTKEAFTKRFGEEKAAEIFKEVNLDQIISQLSAGRPYLYTFLMTNDHGETVRKQLKFSWVSEEHDFILETKSDITAAYLIEQKQMERLRETLNQLEAANNAKTEFVSRISHDIRTPISAIIGMTQFAKEDIDDHTKLLDDIKKIESSNSFLLSLINDILDISKIDSGKIELYPEPYPFDEFIGNIRGMFEPLCNEKKLNFHINSKPEENIMIIVDKVRFNQVAMNILSNAVKYTPSGGTVTYTGATVKVSDSHVKCQYTVTDTGIGMSEDFQTRMFEEFAQEDSDYRQVNSVGGTGLGLAIVKRLIDLMGGTVTVHSQLGKGTSITVSYLLPTASASQAAAMEKTKAVKQQILSCRVLLAEDNEINREIAVRILISLGAEVETSTNGSEAVKKFSSSPEGYYDAILTDLQMPVMDGYEASKAIRKLDRSDALSIPIIAMTANAFKEAVQQAKDAGMNDYITKPVDSGLLAASLNQWIKKR